MSQSVALILHKAQRHAKKGETDLAVQQYKRILQKYPQNKRAIAGLKALQQPERIKKAANPQVSQEQFNGLITLYNQGKLKQALDAGEALEKQFPSTPYIPNLLGAVNAGLGRLEQAVANYEKALAIKPDYAEAYNNMGLVLKDKGESDAAIESFKKALKTKPDYAEAYHNLGLVLKDKGESDAAIESFKKALKIKPDYASAKHLIAALTGSTTDSAPRAYVEPLFDDYAFKFDTSLVGKLEYKIPKTLTHIILTNKTGHSLGSILDLGCGTGLAGVGLRDLSQNLEGIDLSNLMLEQARQKKCL